MSMESEMRADVGIYGLHIKKNQNRSLRLLWRLYQNSIKYIPESWKLSWRI